MKPIAIGSSHHCVARTDWEVVHAVRRVSDIQNGTERATRVDLRALTHKNAGADRVCPLHKLSEEGRLPDAGLTGYEGGPAPASEAVPYKVSSCPSSALRPMRTGQRIRRSEWPSVCCHAPSGLVLSPMVRGRAALPVLG